MKHNIPRHKEHRSEKEQVQMGFILLISPFFTRVRFAIVTKPVVAMAPTTATQDLYE